MTRLLIDERDMPAEIVQRQRAQVVAVQTDDAAVGVEQSHQEVGDRRLAAAARPDDRQHFAGADAERQPIEHRVPRSNVSVTFSNAMSPRTAVSATAAPAPRTSTGASRISDTRRSDTRAVAMLA